MQTIIVEKTINNLDKATVKIEKIVSEGWSAQDSMLLVGIILFAIVAITYSTYIVLEKILKVKLKKY